MMELELGLSLPCGSGFRQKLVPTRRLAGLDLNSPISGKRSFHEPSDQEQQEKKKDEEKEVTPASAVLVEKRKITAVVGWPPVKSRRIGASTGRGSCCIGAGNKLVKVRVEGAAIGRKVDLLLHNSYQSLLRTLERMFGYTDHQQDAAEEKQTLELLGGRSGHHHDGGLMVTYEDGDGDWMLVGDVPWEAFIATVKRLKIVNHD